MLRQTITILIALILFSSMAGCGTSETPTAEVKTIVQTVAVEKEVTRQVTVISTVEVESPPSPVVGQTLQFWSTETQPERAQKTQEILQRFTEKTGIQVELILTDENALPSLTSSAIAAGTLPDVIFHPLDFTVGWAEEGILDPVAATHIIEALGQETFAEGPLNLVKVDDGFAAIPADGWGQLLIYRADWFEKEGLDPPTTYEAIETAAAALHNSADDIYGIAAATKAGEVFTQQTFEHFALANGCQLIDEEGNITLDTPECIEALDFYTRLVRNYGLPGDQDFISTRTAYFAGEAAMIIWSPFILDELAGLRDDNLPTCPECEDNLTYLAENSKIVPAFSGPNGSPTQYGQVSYMGITTNANEALTQTFLEFWFTEGYLEWLSVSAEGKFPMRWGTSEEPDQFITGWKRLEMGVDRKATIGSIYGDELIDTLLNGANHFDRWGFAQGHGALITPLYESLPIPKYLRDAIDEIYTAEEAILEMEAEIEALHLEVEALTEEPE